EALPLAARVREAHAAWREASQRLERARAEHEALERERSAIETDLEALRALAPGADEWSALTADQARLAHARELAESAAAAHVALGGDEALIEQIDGLAARLRQVARFDERLLEACARIEGARAELGEAEQFLRHYASRIDLDPDHLAEVETRMSAWFALARRLKVRPEALAEHWQRLEGRLGELAAAQDVARLEAEVDEAARALASAAATLSERRALAARSYAERVNRDLEALALGQAAIEVRLEPEAEITAHGAERVEIFFRSHPALPFAPLARVASGGELARLSLALLVALGDAGSGPTLIFDEADVGVGGKVAAQVGRRLQQLAGARQVIAVTHMPQVAAHADVHLLVSREHGASPATSVRVLDEAARVDEVARMLAGHEHTEATRRLASELIRTSARTVA
ncbi:MAG: DNA repair protein RecN, partial [Casimicrobiaceae bacterium]